MLYIAENQLFNTRVHGSTVHSCQKGEMAQVPIRGWVGEESVVHLPRAHYPTARGSEALIMLYHGDVMLNDRSQTQRAHAV